MDCLTLCLRICPCIDTSRVDIGVSKKLREKNERHTGTIQVHGSGVSELVGMYPLGNFRTNMVCKFAILFHKEGHSIS